MVNRASMSFFGLSAPEPKPPSPPTTSSSESESDEMTVDDGHILFNAYCLSNGVDMRDYNSDEDPDYVPNESDADDDGTDDEGVPEAAPMDDDRAALHELAGDMAEWAMERVQAMPAIGSITRMPCASEQCRKAYSNHLVCTDETTIHTHCLRCEQNAPLCSNEMYKFQNRHFLDVLDAARRLTSK